MKNKEDKIAQLRKSLSKDALDILNEATEHYDKILKLQDTKEKLREAKGVLENISKIVDNTD
jgi:hypothetical protein